MVDFPEKSAKVAVLCLAPKTFLFQHASLLRCGPITRSFLDSLRQTDSTTILP